jgi:thioredoxin reductase
VESSARWDCIVIGGGAAGLSAALVLGRARRPTLLVDAGEPSNRPAEGIGGLLGHDGRPPADLYARGRAELASYPDVEIREDEVGGGSGSLDGFTLDLRGGSQESGRRVLLATGMDYRFPSLQGAAERWGRSVFHCPFCHGWEVRDRHVGVVDGGPTATRRALLLRAWTDRITLFGDGPLAIENSDADRLLAAGIALEERKIERLDGKAPALESVLLDDGTELDCEALLVATMLHQRSDLAARMGASIAEPSPPVADRIEVDSQFETSVPGLFAAGDLTVQMPSVANAIAAGSTAAAVVVHSLTA